MRRHQHEIDAVLRMIAYGSLPLGVTYALHGILRGWAPVGLEPLGGLVALAFLLISAGAFWLIHLNGRDG